MTFYTKPESQSKMFRPFSVQEDPKVMTHCHYGSRLFFVLSIVCALTISACGLLDDDSSGMGPGSLPTGPQVFAIGTDADHPVLSNQPGDNAQVTGFFVNPGDTLEIQPAYLTHEQRSALPPQVTRLDNPVCTQTQTVCVDSQPIIQNQCQRQCQPCMECFPVSQVCPPYQCCETVCKPVTVGSQCIQSVPECTEQQDQWKEITQYPGLGPSTTEQDDSPMTESAEMLAGLELQFISDGATAPVICPLSQFQPKVSANQFVVTLRNVGGCQAFAAGSAMLGIVNQMGQAFTYPSGIQVKTWDGRTLESPTTASYLPAVDFAGTLALNPAPGAAALVEPTTLPAKGQR